VRGALAMLLCVTTTISAFPDDESGRLLHAEDAVAQACLAVRRLEAELVRQDVPAAAITAVRVLADPADPTVSTADLVEVVTEELDRLAVHVTVTVGVVHRFTAPGMLVGVEADVVAASTHTIQRGATMESTVIDLAPLRRLRSVLTPGDAGYEEATQAWNLAVRQRPAAVAVPNTVEEVQEVVRIAAACGLRIAPQSTGHAASALERVPFGDVILLRLHGLIGVEVDPGTRTVRVVGGTTWGDVVAATAPHGLTVLHGSAADVAVAGFVLGGGVSFFAREFGFTASTVRAVEIVSASGELVRATAEANADLFWAVRGGGGDFGVVVSVELEALAIPDVVAGMMIWDLDHAPEVLRTWTAWTEGVPETVTSSIRLMRFPDLPELPPFLSGRRLVVVDGAVHEDDGTAAELLAPLRARLPEIDTFSRVPTEALLAVHMDPPGPAAGVSDHAMLGALPEEARRALLAVAGPEADTPLTFAELRHLGGAVSRPQDAALSHLPGQYALLAMQAAPTPESEALGAAVTGAVIDALLPWAEGPDYPNFSERADTAELGVESPAWSRLARIRDEHDPGRLWVSAHPVGHR
jgi:FAD/FMN-containing dehydrogenase